MSEMPNTTETAPEPRPLVIVGAGGHGMEVLWVAARISMEPGAIPWNVLGFVDDRENMRGRMIEGVPILGTVANFIEENRGRPLFFHCAIGNNLHRQKVANLLEAEGFQPATLIDPLTIVSPRAVVGAGTYIGPRCYVGPAAKVGRYVLINIASSVGHHCVMGDYSQACPGVRANGHCVVGKLAFLGSNASIHPGKRVGDNATVAANSFVVRDVRPNALVMGVPATTVQYAPPMAEDNEPKDIDTPTSN